MTSARISGGQISNQISMSNLKYLAQKDLNPQLKSQIKSQISNKKHKWKSSYAISSPSMQCQTAVKTVIKQQPITDVDLYIYITTALCSISLSLLFIVALTVVGLRKKISKLYSIIKDKVREYTIAVTAISFFIPDGVLSGRAGPVLAMTSFQVFNGVGWATGRASTPLWKTVPNTAKVRFFKTRSNLE